MFHNSAYFPTMLQRGTRKAGPCTRARSRAQSRVEIYSSKAKMTGIDNITHSRWPSYKMIMRDGDTPNMQPPSSRCGRTSFEPLERNVHMHSCHVTVPPTVDANLLPAIDQTQRRDFKRSGGRLSFRNINDEQLIRKMQEVTPCSVRVGVYQPVTY